MSSKTKMQSAMLRAALLRTLADLTTDPEWKDSWTVDAIRQALDARTCEDVQDWFDTWPIDD